MKRTKRVKRNRTIARLQASAGVERWREELRELRWWRRLPKKRVTLKLDADVVVWFRGKGRGYQWQINRALRKAMETVGQEPSA